MALLGLTSYLILIGLYISAVSLAGNIELRKLVFASARRQFDFLSSIGTAHMEGHIDKIVKNIVKENPEITRIEESSPSLEEIKDYTREVLEEIEKSKSKS